MKQERYIFPAVFTFYNDENGKSIGITFPDLPGCVSCGDNIQDALNMARDALGSHLFCMELDNDNIPTPSDCIELKTQLENNQEITLIDVFMPKFRDAANNKAVNRTVTLPFWLMQSAKSEDINLSQTLQDALMQKLGINREIKRRHYKTKEIVNA